MANSTNNSRIVDAQGNPIERGALSEPQTSAIRTLQSNFLTPMLDGLTPARIASALRAADNGDLVQQHRLFADMEERDPHLLAELNKRKLAVMGLDWDIVPPRNATPAEEKAAAWVKEVLTDAADPFEDLLLALMDGVGHGFAAVELLWLLKDGLLLPQFYPRPQEWFRLSRDRRELRLRDDSADGAQLRPSSWVFHTHGKAKTGYLARMGLHRVLVWPFLYKAYSTGDFAEFLEIYGLPLIVGKYYSGATPEEKSSLMQAVARLGHDARAIMPLDMQLEIQKVTGSGESTPHLAMMDWADRAQSKAILGQTLSAEARATGMGSGVADLHNEVRDDIRNADARQIAATITRDLVYPLIVHNLGDINGLSRCPRLVFDTSEADDMTSMADSLPKLAAIGMKIPVQWAHERLRIPMPETEQEDVLKVAVPPAPDNAQNKTPPQQQAKLTAKIAAENNAQPAQDGTHLFADQAALDAALAALDPAQMQAQMESMLGGLLDALAKTGSYEAAQSLLANAYPHLPGEQVERLLAQAMFVAELWGAASAAQDEPPVPEGT